MDAPHEAVVPLLEWRCMVAQIGALAFMRSAALCCGLGARLRRIQERDCGLCRKSTPWRPAERTDLGRRLHPSAIRRDANLRCGKRQSLARAHRSQTGQFICSKLHFHRVGCVSGVVNGENANAAGLVGLVDNANKAMRLQLIVHNKRVIGRRQQQRHGGGVSRRPRANLGALGRLAVVAMARAC